MTRKPIGHDWHGSWLEVKGERDEWKARAEAAEAEVASLRVERDELRAWMDKWNPNAPVRPRNDEAR